MISNTLPATNEDTIGPYYPIAFADGPLDLTVPHPGTHCAPKGRKICLTGRLLDRHGDLANGALIEFWQANANGVYRTPETEQGPGVDPMFEGFARLRTPDGRFALTTIKPGAAPGRAPNITVTVFSDGITRVMTQVFFADEASNAADPLLTSLPEGLRSRLIARHDGRKVDGAENYTIDIVMAGENETPFFDLAD